MGIPPKPRFVPEYTKYSNAGLPLPPGPQFSSNGVQGPQFSTCPQYWTDQERRFYEDWDREQQRLHGVMGPQGPIGPAGNQGPTPNIDNAIYNGVYRSLESALIQLRGLMSEDPLIQHIEKTIKECKDAIVKHVEVNGEVEIEDEERYYR